MVHILRGRAATASALLAAILVAGIADAAAGPRRLLIRVYDTTTLTPERRAAALAETTRVLEDALISPDWRVCSSAQRCDDPRRTGELVLRIVPTAPAAADPGASSIATRRAPDAPGLALAFAVVHPRTRLGALATVVLDRVQHVASRTGVDIDLLLGRAIAHEIGHLLLGTSGHRADGLMREAWTDHELVLDRPGDFRFAVTDRPALRASIDRLR